MEAVSSLDGKDNRRVIYINGLITPTIDGFTITNGNATGWGGLSIYSTMQDLIRINGNHFLDNRATFGGGINSASPQARPVIYDNVFINNSASKAAGLIVWGESTISKNHFQNSLTGDPAFKDLLVLNPYA